MRSRMGSDAASRHRQRGRKVSIRAPAWGATTEWIGQILSCHVSIRAPAWGATLFVFSSYGQLKFQFALPHGERLQGRPGAVLYGVSIRAPAWGATQRFSALFRNIIRFNSRSRMGSDPPAGQSPAWCCCFNSRSRMGSDMTLAKISGQKDVFQFALPHGERRAAPVRRDQLETGFNSRSRMGSDRQVIAR